MRLRLLLIFLLNQTILSAQTSDTAITASAGLSIDKVKQRQERINAFADSINNYKGGALPEFLFNECFDAQSDLWDGMHSPVSLRWKVLEKVNSKQALKQVMAMHDKRLKTKCRYDKSSNPEIEIPLIRKSFCQLIRKRYKQL